MCADCPSTAVQLTLGAKVSAFKAILQRTHRWQNGHTTRYKKSSPESAHGLNGAELLGLFQRFLILS